MPNALSAPILNHARARTTHRPSKARTLRSVRSASLGNLGRRALLLSLRLLGQGEGIPYTYGRLRPPPYPAVPTVPAYTSCWYRFGWCARFAQTSPIGGTASLNTLSTLRSRVRRIQQAAICRVVSHAVSALLIDARCRFDDTTSPNQNSTQSVQSGLVFRRVCHGRLWPTVEHA